MAMAEQSTARDSINVITRFRPLSKKELDEGGLQCAKFLGDDSVQIEIPNTSRDPLVFTSDLVLSPTSSQTELFQHAALPIVQDVMHGYNGTLFAYGQTGAGKTYTMMGPDIDGRERGLVPRIVESVFGTIESSPEWMEFTVKCSFMEIYMEKIRDLLNPTSDNLPIHEDKGRGVYVKGLLECYVGEIGEVYEIMRRGMANRQTAETNMNEASSRSHSIFLLTITQRNLQTGSNKSGRLYLVDLAGSEKVSKTGATGQVLEEAKKINKSLSALGNVINALTDGKSSHIPYRDSKLTRILQESIGGNSKTTLITCCSPSTSNSDETISTLRFGMRAKCIQNRAHVNVEMSVSELKKVLKGLKEELEFVRRYSTGLEEEITVWRGGGNVPPEKQTPSRIRGKDATSGLPNPPPTPTGSVHSSPSTLVPHRPSSAASVTTVATGRPTTPTMSDEANLSTSSLPTLPSETDENLYARENELADQLAEKERELEALRRELAEARTAVGVMDMTSNGLIVDALKEEVEQMTSVIKSLEYELKERGIIVDGLQEAKLAAEDEVATLIRENEELQDVLARQSKAASSSDKDRRRVEKLIKVVAELSPGVNFEVREQQIREALQRLEAATDSEGNLHVSVNGPVSKSGNSTPQPTLNEGITSATDEAERTETVANPELAARLITLSSMLETTQAENIALRQRLDEVEAKYEKLEADFEEVLQTSIVVEEENTASEHDLVELKAKIEVQYNLKQEQQQNELESIRRELSKKEEELGDANALAVKRAKEIEDLHKLLSESASHGDVAKAMDLAKREEEIEKIKKQMAQQLVDFDAMKKRLMQNLQQRVDRVIELEVSLDETREQYTKAIGSGANREQQRKLAFLERNLEQLTTVQRQLIESNQNLKKELTMADRKLAARNERIQTLEILLQDTQEKFKDQQHRFEQELTTLRQKLQEATIAAQANPTSPREGWLWSHSKIAKPLRGGKLSVGGTAS
ncbi:kinesin-domain-containing protein [Gonapodya prolifera JEL478]|uniref:Kinesin-like protein n=1 Tax=Gonapodya prolifera (strain JEL478) TaxID=1344416 RepID=A0A139A0C2_GONPJ|nr:kinesin-domain-containing protein [Gonapodya prolifera JEL478]|eukprot:KXS10182.1 kinesin-domain-containing protein [Gonapodya prolifera JEL478]